MVGHALHQVGLHEKAGLAAEPLNRRSPARFCSARSWGLWVSVVHGQPFRLGQQDVVVKHRVDVRAQYPWTVPQRALPYSTPRRYFLAFLPLQYTTSRTMPPHRPRPPPEIEQVQAGERRSAKARRKSRPRRCSSFPDRSAPAASRYACPSIVRTGTQTADTGRLSDYQLFYISGFIVPAPFP